MTPEEEEEAQQLEEDLESERRIRRLWERFSRMKLIGGEGVLCEGSTVEGYAISGSISGAILTGACCVAGSCSIKKAEDCINSGGTYLGTGTTCTPNPCGGALGACCVSTACSLTTLPQCTSMGGIFKGYGTTCAPDPCSGGACCDENGCVVTSATDCAAQIGKVFYPNEDCDPNPCACVDLFITINLTCDSIFAERLKCGATEFSGFISTPPKYYFTREHHVTRTETRTAGSPCSTNWDVTTTTNYTLDVEGNCIASCICSGPGCTGDRTFSWVAGGVAPCGGSTWQDGCHFVGGVGSEAPFCDLFCINTGDQVTTGGPTSSTVSVETCVPATSPDPHTDVELTVTTTLSNEYTTSQLISNTYAALPSYDGVYHPIECGSFRYVSDEDPGYSGVPFCDIERFKPRFTFAAQVFDFEIHYIERTVFDAGGEQSIGRTLFVAAGLTSIDGAEVFEPSSNGFTDIDTSKIKSCVTL